MSITNTPPDRHQQGRHGFADVGKLQQMERWWRNLYVGGQKVTLSPEGAYVPAGSEARYATAVYDSNTNTVAVNFKSGFVLHSNSDRTSPADTSSLTYTFNVPSSGSIGLLFFVPVLHDDIDDLAIRWMEDAGGGAVATQRAHAADATTASGLLIQGNNYLGPPGTLIYGIDIADDGTITTDIAPVRPINYTRRVGNNILWTNASDFRLRMEVDAYSNFTANSSALTANLSTTIRLALDYDTGNYSLLIDSDSAPTNGWTVDVAEIDTNSNRKIDNFSIYQRALFGPEIFGVPSQTVEVVTGVSVDFGAETVTLTKDRLVIRNGVIVRHQANI